MLVALDLAVFTGPWTPLPGPVLFLPPPLPRLMNALTVQTHFHWALKSLLREAKTFGVPLQRPDPESENKHVTVCGEEQHGSIVGCDAGKESQFSTMVSTRCHDGHSPYEPVRDARDL